MPTVVEEPAERWLTSESYTEQRAGRRDSTIAYCVLFPITVFLVAAGIWTVAKAPVMQAKLTAFAMTIGVAGVMGRLSLEALQQMRDNPTVEFLADAIELRTSRNTTTLPASEIDCFSRSFVTMGHSPWYSVHTKDGRRVVLPSLKDIERGIDAFIKTDSRLAPMTSRWSPTTPMRLPYLRCFSP